MEELIALGPISSLGERVSPTKGEMHSIENPIDGVTVAYHRDNGMKKDRVINMYRNMLILMMRT